MLEELQACKTRRALANYLEIPIKELTFALYVQDPKTRYKSFCISKKSGGTRQILAPNAKLKFIQRSLLDKLHACDKEIRRASGRMNNLQFGFRKKTGIFDNARLHTKRRFVLNIDIQNYFDQINFGRVRGFFIKSNDYSLNKDVATVIAQIVCFDNKLPQGAPTSPLIAGLVTEFFDVRLARFLARNNCTFTRYCDDVTVSTNVTTFPETVAVQDPIWPGGWKLSEDLEEIFERSGLPINYDKVRMSHGPSQKMVTGLVVNRYPNIPANFYKDTRVWVDSYARTGKFVYQEFCDDFGENCPDDSDANNKSGTIQLRNDVNRLAGRLAYIATTKSKTIDVRYPSIQSNLNPQFWSLLQKFVFVKNFVANRRATILTEGPSDIIHLKAAIRLNPSWAPNIYDPKQNHFLAHFFRHEGMFSKSVGIAGGSGNISRFLDFFYNPPSRVNLKLRTSPVVIVTDNDGACTPLFKRFSNIHKIKISCAEPTFAHKLQDHFYLIKSPHVGKKIETSIEDMFDKNILSGSFAGKTFEPDPGKFDAKKNIGKVALASLLSKAGDKAIYAGFEAYIKSLDKCVSETL